VRGATLCLFWVHNAYTYFLVTHPNCLNIRFFSGKINYQRNYFTIGNRAYAVNSNLVSLGGGHVASCDTRLGPPAGCLDEETMMAAAAF